VIGWTARAAWTALMLACAVQQLAAMDGWYTQSVWLAVLMVAAGLAPWVWRGE
jgi:hypothetical protein